jgi:hypothetical protein
VFRGGDIRHSLTKHRETRRGEEKLDVVNGAMRTVMKSSGVPRNFVRGGVQQIQLKTDRTGIGGSGPLVRDSGGSCNLVQDISFHIVKFS